MSADNQTIEHVVLLNVKDGTDSTKITSMIDAINCLNSLDQVLYLTVGPIHKIQSSSSSFNFTHFVHGRFKTKQDLNEYHIHSNHVSVLNEFVLPICDDIMVVDWISNLEDPLVPKSGSAMKVKLLKLKEDLGENEKIEVLDAIGKTMNDDSIEQISFALDSNHEEKVKDLLESEIVLDYVVLM
ncbi:Stress responsive alpha-beta barrel [Macleaya cordata]|uniref:Stress responsive alpha-beta barrel n=1 Tax=Macleaya cordata TaxID=56857 RepID=A0A200QLQ8_MACCD|nr:Stress responsive alpha-beta barrel [Macleaya cordata]